MSRITDLLAVHSTLIEIVRETNWGDGQWLRGMVTAFNEIEDEIDALQVTET